MLRNTYRVIAGKPLLRGKVRENGELVELTAIEAEFPLNAGSIEPGAPSDDDEGGDQFSGLNKDELLKEAELRGLEDVKPAMRKDDILAALREHEESA